MILKSPEPPRAPVSTATLRLCDRNSKGEVMHDPMASKLVAHEIAHLLGAEHDGATSQMQECFVVFCFFS